MKPIIWWWAWPALLSIGCLAFSIAAGDFVGVAVSALFMPVFIGMCIWEAQILRKQEEPYKPSKQGK